MSIDPPATVESNADHEDLESKANQKNRGENDYRKFVGCRVLMPGAGLPPPLLPLPHSTSQGSLQTGMQGARTENGLAMPLVLGKRATKVLENALEESSKSFTWIE